MNSEERELERRQKKEKKSERKRRVAWALVALLVAALIIMRVAEVDFTPSPEGAPAAESSGFPCSLLTGTELALSGEGSNIAVLGDTAYCVTDRKTAKTLYSFDHGYSNPVADFAGSYSLIYDQGSQSYRLDSQSKNVYSQQSEQPIICAGVSDSGAVVLACLSEDCPSTVSVFNRSLDKKLSYDVSEGYVTDVAVDSRGSRVAFAVVSSENARFKTVVYTMNTDDSTPRAAFEYAGSGVLDLRFSSTDLYVVGTDFVSVIDSLKTEKSVYAPGSIEVSSFCYSQNGRLVLAYRSYSGSQQDNISEIRPSGKAKEIVSIDSRIKDISATSSRVAVLTSGGVTVYKISNSQIAAEYPADDSYSSVLILSSDVFARRQAVIEKLSAD